MSITGNKMKRGVNCDDKLCIYTNIYIFIYIIVPGSGGTWLS